MAFYTTGLTDVQVILLSRYRNGLGTKYFRELYSLVNGEICTDFKKFGKVVLEIQAILLLQTNVEMFKLPDRNYFRFCRMVGIGLAHHITEVGVNQSTLCGNMDAIVRNMLTGGQNWPPVLRIDLDGELIVERNNNT